MNTSVIAEAGTAMAEVEAGFRARVAENQRRVFQIAYSVLGNRADAEEVTQEVFLSAYQNFPALRDAEKFRGWVNRIAFRMALNHQRGNRRRLIRETTWHAGSAREGAAAGSDAETRLLLEQLRGAIARLPGKLRSVVQLSLVEEMNAAAIGAVLGLPAGTVRSRLHAAKKLLLEAMQ